MKLSYEWLKEYVDIDAGPEEVAEKLTMSGSEVESIQDTGDDKVMSLEITSNRPDCLNIIGLAREVSTVFDKDLHLPEMAVPEGIPPGEGPQVKCVIKDRKLCPRYTARIITDVCVSASSEKIKKRILPLGLRDVNNIVDVTNFCLMETGQPLHAFDLDRIKGGKIIIREAARGEKIVTIDEVERELEPGMLVIADSERPIAVAGIMGGKDTEVTEDTRNVLLESAYFDPISVRQTARTLGISSDSSYRFERGVDKNMISAASDRAAVLISEEAGGKICAFYDTGGFDADDVSIGFDVEKAEKILGISLDKERVKNILRRLGMMISGEEGTKMKASIPSFREDLRKEIDLVEEIARIYGYDNIPASIPKFVPQIKRKEHSHRVEEKLRELLPAAGLNEIMTYSLISESAAERFKAITEDIIEINNPLSEEQKILTPQLLDGMLRAISWNINRKNNDLGLFEIGKLYSRSGGKGPFRETPAMCIGLTGNLHKDWQDGERVADFYDLKGIIEMMLHKLRLGSVFSGTSIKGLANCAEIKLADKNESIGFLAEVTPKTLDDYDIEQNVYISQIRLDRIIENAALENRYRSIPRFPSSSRDVSILCDGSLAAADIYAVIAASGEELIRGIDLVDVYKGKQIPLDKKSLTYSIKYGMDTRTLTEEEIEAVHSKIKDALAQKLKVTFR
jgi:phenylalanyl-tRNA synthetase beta chain